MTQKAPGKAHRKGLTLLQVCRDVRRRGQRDGVDYRAPLVRTAPTARDAARSTSSRTSSIGP